MGDAVTGISRADSASGEIELGRCCADFTRSATVSLVQRGMSLKEARISNEK
jgi:hypothetical protein